MNHRRKGKILKREKGPRKALINGLMRSVVMTKAITTTETKGKAIRPLLEKLITKELSGTLAGHRAVIAAIGPDAASRLKKDIVPSIGGRKSGFLRITKLGMRKSDATRMVQVSFVD
ncbi:MAG: bL17 family ribosomal protein [Patescibacteria group bacterium]